MKYLCWLFDVFLIVLIILFLRLNLDTEETILALFFLVSIEAMIIVISVKIKNVFKRSKAYNYVTYCILIGAIVFFVIGRLDSTWNSIVYTLISVLLVIFALLNIPMYFIYGKYNPNRTPIDEEYY